MTRSVAAVNKLNFHGSIKKWKQTTLKRPAFNWSHVGVIMKLIKEEECLKIAVMSKKGSKM